MIMRTLNIINAFIVFLMLLAACSGKSITKKDGFVAVTDMLGREVFVRTVLNELWA
jgi:hypothetical protein